MSNINLRISSVIAWTILAEVVRHHGGAGDLRVVELHPGGGQGNLLSIVRLSNPSAGIFQSASTAIGDFNLNSGTMSGFRPASDSNVPWLEMWLENPMPEMVVDIAIQTFDLPIAVSLPPTNRRIFGCRLIAGLLGARMLKRSYLTARMGFCDSSGIGGSGILGELKQFSALFREDADRPNSPSLAADCWLLTEGWEERIVGALRMDGWLSSTASPEIGHDLFPIYRQTHDMAAVLSKAETILRG